MTAIEIIKEHISACNQQLENIFKLFRETEDEIVKKTCVEIRESIQHDLDIYENLYFRILKEGVKR